jgi:hypothetical protein
MEASRCHDDSGRPNSQPQSSLWIIQIRLPHRLFLQRIRPRSSPRRFQHPPPAPRRLRWLRSRQKRPSLRLFPASRRRGKGARTALQKAAEHSPVGRPACSGCPEMGRVLVSIAIRAISCCWIESSRESDRRSSGFFCGARIDAGGWEDPPVPHCAGRSGKRRRGALSLARRPEFPVGCTSDWGAAQRVHRKRLASRARPSGWMRQRWQAPAVQSLKAQTPSRARSLQLKPA